MKMEGAEGPAIEEKSPTLGKHMQMSAMQKATKLAKELQVKFPN